MKYEVKRRSQMYELETLCKQCSHSEVCKHVEEMIQAKRKVDVMESKEPIKIMVKCDKYKRETGNIR